MKEIEPIAFFHSPLTSKFGIPRQSGVAEEVRGRIVFLPKFRRDEALRGLDGLDYLWLIWGFSENDKGLWKETDGLTVRPPRLGGNERMGVFASRSPFRPNGLGLSSVRIAKIEGGEIEVMGADLMNGTPIYDIKPYVPYADSHANARGGFTDSKQWEKLQVECDAHLLSVFTTEEVAALKSVLSNDPRPHYQHDATRIYGMSFAGREVKFKVEGDVLTIVKIE